MTANSHCLTFRISMYKVDVNNSGKLYVCKRYWGETEGEENKIFSFRYTQLIDLFAQWKLQQRPHSTSNHLSRISSFLLVAHSAKASYGWYFFGRFSTPKSKRRRRDTSEFSFHSRSGLLGVFFLFFFLFENHCF